MLVGKSVIFWSKMQLDVGCSWHEPFKSSANFWWAKFAIRNKNWDHSSHELSKACVLSNWGIEEMIDSGGMMVVVMMVKVMTMMMRMRMIIAIWIFGCRAVFDFSITGSNVASLNKKGSQHTPTNKQALLWIVDIFCASLLDGCFPAHRKGATQSR